MERLENYMVANQIKKEQKVAVLLTAIGPETYGLLRNLVTPEKPDSKSYQELVNTLQEHLNPKPLVIAERFNFNNRFRQDGESVMDFAAQLKKLTIHCEFGDFLNEALRDRFVAGLRKEAIQRKLLSERDLTFNKALQIAQSMEMAELQSAELKDTGLSGSASTATIHQINSKSMQSTQAKPEPKKEQDKECFRCGGKDHLANTCRFIKYKCNSCGKKGHLAKVCRSKPNNGEVASKSTHHLEADEVEDNAFGMFAVRGKSAEAVSIPVVVAGKEIVMEVDTGAAVTVIPKEIYLQHYSHLPLAPCTSQLKTYSGAVLPVAGEIMVDVKYQGQSSELPLVVAEIKNQPPVLGRNWLSVIRLNWKELFKVSTMAEELTTKYKSVFGEGLGTIKEFEARIKVKPDANPKFHKARPVPYALKGAVEAELERLEKEGIISKVEHSEWAAPIVVVPKSDGSIRICGDYKVTVNQALDVDQYPLPTSQDLLSALGGGKQFTKLDLKHAYQQLNLHPESKKFLTINTHKGLYQYNRLPFGVASAPAIFQSTMDQILQGIQGVGCYIDDILVTAPTHSEHLQILEEVLQRLAKYGVKLKAEKCSFLQDKVEFLGHMIDAEGVHPTAEKVRALVDAPVPTCVSELRSFLGMLQYYGKFLANLSTLLQPLNNLLREGVPWSWEPECQQAFDDAKKQLLSAKVLMHYDANLPLVLACDASSYGIGAVISHVLENGDERPIAFASRTLSPSEKNYGQIEKEALSIVYGVKKFHQYLYGRKFTLETDHKPLLTILGPKSAVPTLAAARLQRWALILSSYQYDVKFRPTDSHANADALSRLPVDQVEKSQESEVYHFSYVNDLPVTAKDIAHATQKDPVLAQVLQFVKHGWPDNVKDDSLLPFFHRRLELSAEQDCLLWGLRVVIPEEYRSVMLCCLHEDHPGICRMKALARSYLWWPKLDSAIEEMVRNCGACQSVRKEPVTAPLIPWKWPTRVWQRVHIDYAEFEGVYYLVVVDAHSKWPEVFSTSSMTATKTIELLSGLFAAYGLPEELVSDNGPQFTSEEFSNFMKQNGINHTRTPPYHPASNGAAERYVQILKQALKTSKFDKGQPVQRRLSSFLFSYRNTPHTVTGQSPAELFLKRKPRTRLSLLQPNLAQHVEEKQRVEKEQHDRGRTKTREFMPGDQVLVRNFRGQNKWNHGTVILRIGPLAYQVKVGDRMCHAHVDHLLSAGEPTVRCPAGNLALEEVTVPPPLVAFQTPLPTPVDSESACNVSGPTVPTMECEQPKTPVAAERRYPKRQIKPPEKLNL